MGGWPVQGMHVSGRPTPHPAASPSFMAPVLCTMRYALCYTSSYSSHARAPKKLHDTMELLGLHLRLELGAPAMLALGEKQQHTTFSSQRFRPWQLNPSAAQ